MCNALHLLGPVYVILVSKCSGILSAVLGLIFAS
jgi:hypothetical protein